MAEAERPEETLPKLAAERRAAGFLRDQAEHDVVRARVREAPPGRRPLRGMRDRERDELPRTLSPLGIAEDSGILDVVEQTGRVGEQLPHGNFLPARDQAREPALDRVVEP